MHSGCGLLLSSLLLLVAQSRNQTKSHARGRDKAHLLKRRCAHKHDIQAYSRICIAVRTRKGRLGC